MVSTGKRRTKKSSKTEEGEGTKEGRESEREEREGVHTGASEGGETEKNTA